MFTKYFMVFYFQKIDFKLENKRFYTFKVRQYQESANCDISLIRT